MPSKYTCADVDKFLKKTKLWHDEMRALRAILLSTKLDEDFKWRGPCYCYEGSNVVIIQPFKSCLGMMLFKGSLLKDPKKILVDNGPNSQAVSSIRIRFSPRNKKAIFHY